MFTLIWRRTSWLLSAALSLPVALAAQTQPEPPTNVTAAADPRGGVTISWTGPRAKVFYRVLRAPDPKSPGADLTRPLDPGTISFVDGGVAPGTTYFYQVVAVYSDGTQGPSLPIQYSPAPAVAPVVRTAPGPITSQPVTLAPVLGPAPRNVQVPPGGPMVHTLSWWPVSGVSGYNVSLSSNPAASQWLMLNAKLVTTTTFPDTGIRLPGVAYRVTALYPDGRQGSTDFVYANPPQLEVPTGFAVTKRVIYGVLVGRDVQLTWYGVPGAIGYRLFGTGQPPGGTLLPGTLAPPPSSPFAHLQPGSKWEALLVDLPVGVYTWQLTADYGGAWQSAGMPTATITIFDLCAPPQPIPGPAPDTVLLVGHGGSGPPPSPASVTVSWPKVPGAVAYTVERENYTGFGPVVSLGATCATAAAFTGFMVQAGRPPLAKIYFEDRSGGLVVGSTYRYRVTAFGRAGEKGSKTGVWLVP